MYRRRAMFQPGRQFKPGLATKNAAGILELTREPAAIACIIAHGYSIDWHGAWPPQDLSRVLAMLDLAILGCIDQMPSSSSPSATGANVTFVSTTAVASIIGALQGRACDLLSIISLCELRPVLTKVCNMRAASVLRMFITQVSSYSAQPCAHARKSLFHMRPLCGPNMQ